MSPLDYLGVHIPTIVEDNVSIRCDGCLEVIDGTPWRMNILDVVAPETAVSWALRPPLNPGPFEFHGDGAHVRMWMRTKSSEALSEINPMRLFHASNLYLSLLFVAVALDPLLGR